MKNTANTQRLSQQYLLSCSPTQEHTKRTIDTVGIVHLGIGAFHRAHQAVYTDKANRLSDEASPWNILGVSLRSKQVGEQLTPQDSLYTVLETGIDSNSTSIIGSVVDVWHAPSQTQQVLDIMAADNTKIISLTVTEKGYCHHPATGNLNLEHPDIIHDISDLGSPVTAIGFIVASLKQRFEENLPPVTILCCDNLPNNGHTLEKIVAQFAQKVDTRLAEWIAENITFPNTMVDRIVPATTADDIAKLEQESGYTDYGMVKTEHFSQWVIEDKFASGKPAWQDVGAILVQNVEPYETAKLRLLNGAHSALAYLGFLNGATYVHQVMQNKAFVRYLKHMMLHEIAPTIVAPQGLDLNQYSLDLLARFANPTLQHRTYQIAMDGSQKLPQRLLHTIEERLASNQSIECLTFAVCGWLRYSMGFDAKGDLIAVQDPYAAELEAIQKQHFSHIDKLVDQYLGFDKVFSAALQSSTTFRQRLTYWMGIILANGVPTALKTLLLEVETVD